MNEEEEVCTPEIPSGLLLRYRGVTGALKVPVQLGMVGILENSLTSQDLCYPFLRLIGLWGPANGEFKLLNSGPANPEA